MTSRKVNEPHPDHAAEQAYIERVHRAHEHAVTRRQHAPDSAGDRYAARTARAMLEKLSEPIDVDALCFARVDRTDGRTMYLGRGAVHDEQSNLLVVNWRQPAVAGFYKATAQDPHGLVLRRRFQLDHLRLLGIVDDRFHSQPAPPVEPPDRTVSAQPPVSEPHVVDAILADMERARGKEMRDIVATIEARQYELISDAVDGILVIQGGPGSGKTAIALHRAAWLLFNHHEELQRERVLVVGPNRAFMEYVAQVLPALGESSVVQTAVDRLADLPDLRVRSSETVEVARLKGDIRMAAVVQRAVRGRLRLPEQDVTVKVGSEILLLRARDISGAAEAAWRTGRTYLGSRDAFRTELLALATRQIGEGDKRFSVRRHVLRRSPSALEIESAIAGPGGPFERIWPTVTAPEVIRDLLNSRARLASASAGDLTKEESETLQRARARSLREEPWTSSDIALIDEADAALRGVASAYGYVIADEAQDLSPMQLRMVLRRSRSRRGTLVGDIAQATGPTRFADWARLVAAAGAGVEPRVAELAIGYRVPRQIMDLALELLPRVAPDTMAPRAVRSGPEEPRVIAVDDGSLTATVVSEVRRRLEGDRSVGVICPGANREQVRSALVEAGHAAGDILVDGLTRQVTVLSAGQAKGLEFDHVVVVDPASIAGPTGDWAYVYIAITRATRTLSLLHTTPKPFELPSAPEPAEGGDETVSMSGAGDNRDTVARARSVRPTRRHIEMMRAVDQSPGQTAEQLGARLEELTDMVAAGWLYRHANGRFYVKLLRWQELDAWPAAGAGQPSEAVAAPCAAGRCEKPEGGAVLGPRYTEAILQAKFLHAHQQRRGTLVPYLAHLQAVASLVLEDGGTEDEAIAALLHDAVEDHGASTLHMILDQFGPAVARIVAQVTDPEDSSADTWRDRKLRHLRDLESAGPAARRVALAEKLDNARALLRDYRRLQDRLWQRMDVDPEDILWYFSELVDLFVTERPGDLASELQDVVERLLDLSSRPQPDRLS